MQCIDSDLSGVIQVKLNRFEDARGWFTETYNAAAFQAIGIPDIFVQDNHSFSQKGVLRGMHFQYAPHATAKLVRCTRGKIFDVVVDLRANSPTFLRMVLFELAAEDDTLIYIPVGCAHGFYAREDAELQYKVTAHFVKEADGVFAWNDPALAIPWPTKEVILSDKDRQAPTCADALARGQVL